MNGSLAHKDKPLAPWRRLSVLVVYLLCVGIVVMRALDLQIMRSDFFREQGDARQLRVVSVPAHRGEIVDRHGEPLAVSTPIHSVWVNPAQAMADREGLLRLASLLELNSNSLLKRIESNSKREFLYIKRHISPELAEDVAELGVAGVALQNEYKRFYPNG